MQEDETEHFLAGELGTDEAKKLLIAYRDGVQGKYADFKIDK